MKNKLIYLFFALVAAAAVPAMAQESTGEKNSRPMSLDEFMADNNIGDANPAADSATTEAKDNEIKAKPAEFSHRVGGGYGSDDNHRDAFVGQYDARKHEKAVLIALEAGRGHFAGNLQLNNMHADVRSLNIMDGTIPAQFLLGGSGNVRLSTDGAHGGGDLHAGIVAYPKSNIAGAGLTVGPGFQCLNDVTKEKASVCAVGASGGAFGYVNSDFVQASLRAAYLLNVEKDSQVPGVIRAGGDAFFFLPARPGADRIGLFVNADVTQALFAKKVGEDGNVVPFHGETGDALKTKFEVMGGIRVEFGNATAGIAR